MDKRKGDWLIITFVSILICWAGYMILTDRLNTEPPKEHCTYEIKYLHMSGREVTKRVYMTCQGFHPWFEDPQRYKVPTMILPFSDGNEVLIQGATDIFSVAKIKDNE